MRYGDCRKSSKTSQGVETGRPLPCPRRTGNARHLRWSPCRIPLLRHGPRHRTRPQSPGGEGVVRQTKKGKWKFHELSEGGASVPPFAIQQVFRTCPCRHAQIHYRNGRSENKLCSYFHFGRETKMSAPLIFVSPDAGQSIQQACSGTPNRYRACFVHPAYFAG